MKKNTRHLAHAAIIAGLYAALTFLQNLLLPGSASWVIQFRASEALCMLALFTPAAVPGLTIGCALFNLTFAGALPLDVPVGSLATLLAVWGMYLCRKLHPANLPVPALLFPVLTNAVLVGWELSVYVGGGFWLNALFVAIGEAAVLLSFGAVLYRAINKRNLTARLFG